MTASDGARAAARVLLVDDHRLFAEVLAMRLAREAEIASVELATSLPIARTLLHSMPVDVVLLDYDLDGTCGLELVPDIARIAPRPPVLVLSGGEGIDAIVRALRTGVSGWVSKGSAIPDLTAAISAVRHAGLALPGHAWEPVVRTLLAGPVPDAGDVLIARLTPRRADVLRCLVEGLSQREIGARLQVSENTVRTHVQALFRQLDVHSTPELTALARRAGVAPAEPPTGTPARVPAQTAYRDHSVGGAPRGASAPTLGS